ncbi:MAG: hypothetical protein QOF61_918, partial [Acidobacteriota bacterium]|nr:hypothetical protein [Acidobacteriota bacterium]
LAPLPPCFRWGLGWLVGGSRGHAQAFGAKLLLDADLTTEGETLDKCLADGESLLSAWATVECDDDFKDAVAREAVTPLWEWEEKLGWSVAGFAPRLVLLAELLEKWREQSPPDDATLARLEKALAQQGALDDKLRLAALELLRAAGARLRDEDKRLSAVATKFLLGEHFAKRFSAASMVGDFNEAELQEYFVGASYEPEEKSCGLKLSYDTRLAIWRKHVESEVTAEGAAQQLFAALRALGYSKDSPHKAALDELITNTFAGYASSEPLDLWDRFKDYDEWNIISKKLMVEARARVQTRSRRNGWELEYLMYAHDEGGAHLSTLDLSRSESDALVKKLIGIAKGTDANAEKSQQWLHQLHHSKLRSKLSLDTKHALLDYSQEEWRDLAYLWRLYDFKEGDGQIEKPQIFQEFIPFLQEEMGQLAEITPLGVPHLERIATLLGGLNEPVKDKLKAIRPPLNGTTIKRWRAGWVLLGDKRFALDEVIRLLMESNAPLEKFSLDEYGFNDDQIAKLIGDLLYNGSEERDQRYASTLMQLLKQSPRADRVHLAVQRGVRDLVRDETSVGIFARRFVFAGRRIALNLIFECLTEADADVLVLRAARHDPRQFEEVASYLYQDIEPVFFKDGREQGGVKVRNSVVVKSNELARPYKSALIRFIQSREGRAVKRALADNLPGWRDNYELVSSRFDELNNYISQKKSDRAEARQSTTPPDAKLSKPDSRSSAAPRVAQESEARESQSPVEPVLYAPPAEGLVSRVKGFFKRGQNRPANPTDNATVEANDIKGYDAATDAAGAANAQGMVAPKDVSPATAADAESGETAAG